jgi:hypothetical protein
MSKLKTYSVVFASTQHMRIELKARSEEAAIRKAEHLWCEVDSDDPRFEQFGGDAFHDEWAEEASQ